jgi:periplasmic protein CpxP/Spy
MKKQTLTLAALAVATFGWISVASAQGPGGGYVTRPDGPGGPGFGPRGPGGHGGPPIGIVARHLGLSDEQREQWKAIHEKAREAGEPLMKATREAKAAFDKALEAENADANTVGQAALAMRAAHKNAEAHRKATFESVKAILTPEQLARVEEMEKQGPRRDKGFGPGAPGGPGGPEGGLRKRQRPEGSN